MIKKILFQNQPVYEISNGDSVARIAPQQGARLIDWRVAGQKIIFWPEHANWDSITLVRGGNPILFPFIGRHMVDGTVGWWIDQHGVKRALPMHGFAQAMPFSIISNEENCALHMRLLPTDQTREYYPFEFLFDVVYRLGANRLEARLEITNTGFTPMPYYMGHHYYFSIPHQDRDKWELKIPCSRRGRQNSDGSVNEAPTNTHTFLLSDPTLSDTMQIGLYGSKLTLHNKETGRGVFIELGGSKVSWYAVTTWVETRESDYYCVEPWTALPNAIHHGKGLRYLEPGKTESAVCILKAKTE